MSNPLTEGQVTIADLYRVLTGMSEKLTGVLIKLEVIESRNATADSRINDHEARLRAVESGISRAKAIAGTIGGGLGLSSGFITAILTRH